MPSSTRLTIHPPMGFIEGMPALDIFHVNSTIYQSIHVPQCLESCFPKPVQEELRGGGGYLEPSGHLSGLFVLLGKQSKALF